MYTDILRHLRDAVRRKRPKKGRTFSWFILHNNAPAHRSVLVKYLLPNNNVTTLQHSPYFPYQAAADFVLFPLMSSALKGRRFYNATDIIKNATEELKRL